MKALCGLSNRSESLFSLVLTVYSVHSGKDEFYAHTEDNGRVQTLVFGQTKEVQSVDIASSEAVEAELDRLIERRSSREPVPDEREELWKASVRVSTTRGREEMRASWCEHHQGQSARLRANLEALIARHEEQAALLEDEAS